MVILGATGLAALLAVWLSLPEGAPAAEQARRRALLDVHQALCEEDPQALSRARTRLRGVVSRDLLGRHLPPVLSVVERLRQTDARCDPGQGPAATRGVCLLRQRRFTEAVVAFSAVPDHRGGAGYREVGAALLRLHRRRVHPPTRRKEWGRGGDPRHRRAP